jgi:hypothetical protein
MEQKPLVLILLLLALNIFAQENGRPEFYEYGSLNPQINNLDRLSWKEGRTLLFGDAYGGKKIIITDTAFRRTAALDSVSDITAARINNIENVAWNIYWDFHTKQSFINAAGWHLLEKNGTSFQTKRVGGINFAYPSADRVRIVMDRGDVLTVVHNYQTGMNELTVTSSANEVFFRAARPPRLFGTTWIGGDWIFMDALFRSPAGGWGFEYDTIVNYRTGEERSFYPEIIVGFGKNLVMTTSTDDIKRGITSKELIGITLWNLDNEIIYRDASFDLCGMLEWGVFYWSRALFFCSVDLPYVYVPVYTRGGGPSRRVSYGILDLYNGKAHASGFAGAFLLGTFE